MVAYINKETGMFIGTAEGNDLSGITSVPDGCEAVVFQDEQYPDLIKTMVNYIWDFDTQTLLDCNIYFEYVTAAEVETADRRILTTGEIMWAYRGSHQGEWTEVDAGCAVIGPYPYGSADQILLDAGADTELYFISGGVVLIKPNAEAIKQAREANRVPTTEEQVATLKSENERLNSSNKSLSEQVNGLIDYMVQTGQLV